MLVEVRLHRVGIIDCIEGEVLVIFGTCQDLFKEVVPPGPKEVHTEP